MVEQKSQSDRDSEIKRIYKTTINLINKLEKDKDKSFPQKLHSLITELKEMRKGK